ncbi:hypothetical protein FB451DRAFT_1556620 [Mycena latifolia]|nr:hypothetical protein FB451DRAFT_1556620 [Mycena latifolia]
MAKYVTPSSNSLDVGPLATSAQGVGEIVPWMAHKDRTPFCIPAAPNPDVLFVLKLADGSFLWVIVQGTPAMSDCSDLLAFLEEDALFCDGAHDPESSAHKRAFELLKAPPSGSDTSTNKTPTVLRVVASFRDQIELHGQSKVVRASLALDMLQKLTAVISPSEIVESFVASVLGKRKEGPVVGKGEGRKKKRKNSFPVAAEEEHEQPEKGSRKKKAKTPEPSTRVLRPRPQTKESPQ